eukprot:TRINITY_DN12564_c0_g1_i1.p1 TRINITY_DN12564_c0_g1~~TRINITY_DN12564_c0_g1_i1.p1  ORF type:complete len:114 (+),score=9.72 TRINITY_DN12564_c0_g1_i1:3234-3575(+)
MRCPTLAGYLSTSGPRMLVHMHILCLAQDMDSLFAGFASSSNYGLTATVFDLKFSNTSSGVQAHAQASALPLSQHVPTATASTTLRKPSHLHQPLSSNRLRKQLPTFFCWRHC